MGPGRGSGALLRTMANKALYSTARYRAVISWAGHCLVWLIACGAPGRVRQRISILIGPLLWMVHAKWMQEALTFLSVEHVVVESAQMVS